MKTSTAKVLEKRKKNAAKGRKKNKRPNWHFNRDKAKRKAARQEQKRGNRRR